MTKSENADLGTLEDPGLLQKDLPGASSALSEPEIWTHIQHEMLQPSGSYEIASCNLSAALLYGGDRLLARYELDVVDAAGQHSAAMVTCRAYPDAEQAVAYTHERLAPLVARVQGRQVVAPFMRPVAVVAGLGMVLHAYPLDGELPTLVDATDPTKVTAVLAQLLGAAPSASRNGVVRAETAHYNRRHRCMLRYTLDLEEGQRKILYGKVSDDDSGRGVPAALTALRLPLARERVSIPECLGFVEGLRLTVFTQIPGVPLVAHRLKSHLRGEDGIEHPTVEDAIDTCGRIAAALHRSGLRLGPVRTLDRELSRLRANLAPIRRLSPGLARQLAQVLDEAQARVAAHEGLSLCQSHGDFSYTQLLFDGDQAGVVDFDNLCQAEPSLDLGQFLAYLHYAGLKAGGPVAGRVQTVHRLARRFTQAYTEEGGTPRALDRVAIYKIISLVRMAQHAWENLKVRRLQHVMTVLGESYANE